MHIHAKIDFPVQIHTQPVLWSNFKLSCCPYPYCQHTYTYICNIYIVTYVTQLTKKAILHKQREEII